MKLISIKDKEIVVFTDGSSRGNPGPGGYGIVVIYPNAQGEMRVDEFGNSENPTTNNRMELKAVIEAIRNFENYYVDLSEYTCTVYLDSAYVLNGVTKWITGWKLNGWKTGGGKEDVKNQDLWKEVDVLKGKLTLKFVHIAGHAGIAGNERCDEIATTFADGVSPELYTGPLAGYVLEGGKNILEVEPTAEALYKKAKTSSKKSSTSIKAYSYVSLVGGKISTDQDWKTCENRVKGKSGARFKKSRSAIDEKAIIEDFLKKN
jgi:ribonuclease HI